MRFREFYNDSVFTLLAKDSANWDYYAMQYQGGKPAVVALAKPGSGAEDCFFGTISFFKRHLAMHDGMTRVEERLPRGTAKGAAFLQCRHFAKKFANLKISC